MLAAASATRSGESWPRETCERATWEVRRPPMRWPRPSPELPARPWQRSSGSLPGGLPTGSLLHLSTSWLAGVAAAPLEPRHRQEAVARRQPELRADGPPILPPVREELRSVVARTLVVAGFVVRHGAASLLS